MSTSTPSATTATALTIDNPTHLAEPDRIIDRFTAVQVLGVLCGVLGAVGATQQHGVPVVLRAGEALLIVLAGVLVALWRPGGRSLLVWGRVVLTYRTAPRRFGWAARAAVTDADPRADDLLPPPPHLPTLGRMPVATLAPPPAGAAPQPVCPPSQGRLYVPLTIDDDIVTFADGQHCAALELASAHNAELLDAEGQRQMHAAYGAFLRGLTFPITLTLVVRPADLRVYATSREERARDLPPRLQRLELTNIDYMARSARRLGLVDQRSLLIIPTDAPTTVPPSRLPHRLRRTASTVAPDVERARAARLLAERCAAVMTALAPAGLHARCLGTEELRELWYHHLRPRSAQTQPLRPDHGAATLGARVLYGAGGETDGKGDAAVVVAPLRADDPTC